MTQHLNTALATPPVMASTLPDPVASVVIPSYYHEAYLEAAIGSVLGQTRSDIELIVVDDGSKDRSRRILAGLRDCRVKVVLQENAGAHNAINRGMAMTRAPYISILNSDDVFTPDRLEIMVAEMQEQDADLACSWIQQMDHVGKPGPIKKGWTSQLPSWARSLPKVKVRKSDAFVYELLRSNFISTTSNMVISRRIYEKVGGMRNLRFAHDWDFAFRAATHGRCLMVPLTLMRYRTHGTNTISSNRSWMMFEICWMLAVHFDAMAEQLSHLKHSDLARSHYGALDPTYDALKEALDRAGTQEERNAIAEKLLDDESARAPYIDMINAKLNHNRQES